ncbi:efflux RND transporter permease subunit [Desulfofustis glycolicus]|uniref:Hydrophobe/amphiphile efflux-1 (HAE1) family protein n=1 Tax=Desulfofustis glycolicus DSM 9705 TaxID=1121409 RepID=A0A1M5XP67_9BACT|nr:multidrug efflux RND transporter permease subunit [Desulfofustis glycolicus]SHI01338.1 hydrophobe/amphiphile efflux-1 (HAE1) family protein [Desulfofustis glycolicus DSM 9705]
MAKFFINRPVFAIVTSLILLLAGGIAGLTLPIAQFPQITLPTIQVSAIYPGADAGVVEESVALPIETQINGVEGMSYMSSTASGSGYYSLNVTFGLEADPDIASVQVQNRVAQANAQLPSDVLASGVTTKKTTPDTLMYIALYSPQQTYDELFLANYTAINIVESIKRVKGVGNVQLFGAEFGMRVWLHPERMATRGLTPGDIYQAIKEQNAQAPAGKVGQLPAPDEQQFQYSVQVRGRLSDPEEFENIIVRAQADGSAIRIKDVARVELGAKDYNYAARYNGKPAVAFSINLTPDGSAIETSQLIRKKLDELAISFPDDVDYEIVNDNTVFIKASLESVAHTFFEALLLVLLVVFLFLQSFRATLIPMLAVPVSLVGTFAAFVLLGFTINTMTMFAMVLAIGIVVDDAIIVVEAVEHHMAHGLTPRQATVQAMEEVSGPVIATALILAAVFVPVAFLGGMAGVMYKQFAVTVAVSTLLSAFVALTLTPALCSLLLRPADPSKRGRGFNRFFGLFNRLFDAMTVRYGRTVQVAIKRIVISCTMLAIIILAAFAIMRQVPGAFVPAEDQGYFIGSVIMPDASSLNRTIGVGDQVQQVLMAQPAIARSLVISGFSILTGSIQSDAALFVAVLKPWAERKQPELGLAATMQAVLAEAGAIPEAVILAFNPPPIPGLGATGGFSFKLQDQTGASPMELATVAGQLVAEAKKRPEIGQVYSKFNPGTPAYRLELDRDRAKKLGVAISDITLALQTFLGGLNVNDFTRFGRTYKVTLQAEPQFRSDIDGIRLFHVRNANGEMIPLSNLVVPVSIAAANTLERYNMFRSAELSGEPAPGFSSGEAIKAMEETAAQVLPQGYGYEWSGISLQEKESAGQAPIIFALALVFVFLFLAALYESWSIPFAVLLAVPIGVFGAMSGLWLTGQTNSIYAQIGLILLIGLAAKNAILIVEFAKMKHDEGQSPEAAALEASKLRLRPIIMTSMAFLLGVVPLIIKGGAGAAAQKAMGITVFSGMLTATFIAVFLVPVLFVAISRLTGGRKKQEPAPPPSEAPC